MNAQGLAYRRSARRSKFGRAEQMGWNLSGVTLPNVSNDAPQGMGTILTGVGILALLAPFVGDAIGGA